MVSVPMELIKQLRELSGAGMMDCKNALEEQRQASARDGRPARVSSMRTCTAPRRTIRRRSGC